MLDAVVLNGPETSRTFFRKSPGTMMRMWLCCVAVVWCVCCGSESGGSVFGGDVFGGGVLAGEGVFADGFGGEFEGLEGFVERPRRSGWEPTSPGRLFAERDGEWGRVESESGVAVSGSVAELSSDALGERVTGGISGLSELSAEVTEGAGREGIPGRPGAALRSPGRDSGVGAAGDGSTESLSRRYDGTLFEQLEEEQRSGYEVYRSAENGWLWMPGGGGEFGMLSMYSNAWQPRHNLNGERQRSVGGLDFGFSMHWLDGPGELPLPPRLYDLSVAYQNRGQLWSSLRYDVGVSAGLYTDFEDSVREGWRFPGHAVMMLPTGSDSDLVLGVDYLDRGDMSALPVAGVSLRNVLLDGMRMDLVYPQPRISWLMNSDSRVYTAGVLGGGTWDVEFPDSSGQLVTYRDYRWSVGFEQRQGEAGILNLEVAWVFGRQVERRGDVAALEMGDGLLLIMTVRR